jgi:hypothetical protein
LDLSAWTRERSQRVECTLGLALLMERDADHHDHRQGERERLAVIADDEIDGCRGDQEHEHRLAKRPREW